MGQGENGQTLSEGPFADPAQGAATGGVELGTHRWSTYVPCGNRSGDLPIGEMFGGFNDATNCATMPIFLI